MTRTDPVFRPHSGRRAPPSRAGLAAVAALHVALGYALVAGLDIATVFTPPPPPLIVDRVPVPPPPPEPKPVETDLSRPDTRAPRLDDLPPPVPLPPTTGTVRFDPLPLPEPTGNLAHADDTIVTLPLPKPAVIETFTAARPRPGNSFTEDDYPATSRRAGEEGIVEARYIVGTDGRARDCAVIVSSGFPRLDEATCNRIERRFRFDPARDGTRAVQETRTQKVRWALRG